MLLCQLDESDMGALQKYLVDHGVAARAAKWRSGEKEAVRLCVREDDVTRARFDEIKKHVADYVKNTIAEAGPRFGHAVEQHLKCLVSDTGVTVANNKPLHVPRAPEHAGGAVRPASLKPAADKATRVRIVSRSLRLHDPRLSRGGVGPHTSTARTRAPSCLLEVGRGAFFFPL